MTVYNKSHLKRYELPDKPLSSGGEGAVYEVIGHSELAAKIYHENKRSPKRYEKLSEMIKIPAQRVPECAWPQELLFQDDAFCGFIMKKVSGLGNLVDFFVYENRSSYRWDQYIIAAMNIAAAVNNIHDAGLVIGDLKPDNMIIDPMIGKVKFVDTDSYQVTGSDGTLYPCMVATPEYIPPELQNINFEANTGTEYFNKKTDDFSLAVLIFKVLMNGVHPFACFSPKRSMNNLETNIRHGWSPYFNETDLSHELRLTLRSPEMTVLSPELRELFKQAFVSGRLHPEKRPDASRWFYALNDFLKKLTICRTNSQHMYYSALNTCPWCSLNADMVSRKQEYMQLLNENSAETPWKKSAAAQKRAAKTDTTDQKKNYNSPPPQTPIQPQPQQPTQQAVQAPATPPHKEMHMIFTPVRLLIVSVVTFLLVRLLYGDSITIVSYIKYFIIGFCIGLIIFACESKIRSKKKSSDTPPQKLTSQEIEQKKAVQKTKRAAIRALIIFMIFILAISIIGFFDKIINYIY